MIFVLLDMSSYWDVVDMSREIHITYATSIHTTKFNTIIL